jgi:hypothetical protein
MKKSFFYFQVIMFTKYLLLATSFLFIYSCQPQSPDALRNSFSQPPDPYKPWLYWYWIDENISKEGITKDLEAMARVGIGQALIGHVSPGGERGDVRILSDEWWDMVEHAVREGQRTGVDIGFFNGPGWSQSGGPWIDKDLSMRHVVSKKIKLTGPASMREKISYPDTLFEPIAVQAFPFKSTKSKQPEPVISKLSSIPDLSTIENLFDSDTSTYFRFPDVFLSGNALTVDLHFQDEATIQTIQFDFLPTPFMVDIELQTKDKNHNFQIIRSFTLDRRYINFEIGPMRYQPATFTMPETHSREARIIFKNLTANRGAGIKEIKLISSAAIDQGIEKQLGKMFSGPLPSWNDYIWPDQSEPSAEYILNLKEIIDLTSKIDSEGYLDWEVPAGEWILLYSGIVPTGATNVPVPPEATGYECDKFTDKAIEKHFDNFLGKFLKKVPPDQRKSLKTVVIDSYEVGPQNWTTAFKDIFMKRYGYDPVPWLPVFDGNIIEHADLSNRFLWDVRRLTADLIANVYVKRLREMCNDQKLSLWLENYGHWGFPAEFLQYGGQADQVSGEFWYENHLWDLGPLECRAASSAAHIYGNTQVFAEAFTAGFNFRQYPAMMKSRGDQMFCEGINHMVQHVYIHQPWEDRRPGVTTWFGMSYQRHNTWFEQSKAWNTYLQRCHYLLQQGIPVSDVCYFIGEDAPKMTGILDPSLPTGYDYDFINADVIMKDLAVQDGLLSLPNGKTYQIMILPPLKTMRPELLKQIKKLLIDGARIYGPPPSRSPSMENYPEADEAVRALSDELWGNSNVDSVVHRRIGKGDLYYGESLTQVLKQLRIEPDVMVADTTIRWTHRRVDQTEIYFLSNQEGNGKTIEISFRIVDRVPEFWYPDNGKTAKPAFYRKNRNRILLPVKLDPFGSVFVVFRQADTLPIVEGVLKDNENITKDTLPLDIPDISFIDGKHIGLKTSDPGNYTLIFTDGKTKEIEVSDIPESLILEGMWHIQFPENWDVPIDTVFDELVSWSAHQHEGIRHFSGTATYSTKINIPEELIRSGTNLILDLGKVMVVAEFIVNGSNLGILWKKPYKVDITDFVRSGENVIEIHVTNTWWNRLVGDEKYPDGFPGSDAKENKTYTTHKAWTAEDELLESGLLGPVQIIIEKKLKFPRF